MYSSMIHELDVNSMQYLIDEYKDTIDAQAKELDKQAEELDKQAEEIDEQAQKLVRKDQEIRDSILNLYRNGVSIEVIANSTGHSKQEIMEIVS